MGNDSPDGVSYKIVYDIYAYTESMIYALRRYYDDFLKKFSGLSDLISEIQGIWKTKCFEAHELKEKENMKKYREDKDEESLHVIHSYDKEEGFFENREKLDSDDEPQAKETADAVKGTKESGKSTKQVTTYRANKKRT